MLDKNIKLDVRCPNCGHLNKISLKDIENNTEYTCNSCGKTIRVDGSQYINSLIEAENKIKSTFKNIKI